MTRKSKSSPIEVLVMAQLGRLHSAEASLAKTLSSLPPDGNDAVSEWRLLSSIAEVGDRASRLERMLEAMAGCGFREGSGAGQFTRQSRVLQTSAA